MRAPRSIPGDPGAQRDAGPGRGPGPARTGAGSGTPGGVKTMPSQEREPDVRAITGLLASFVKAYNEKDAKLLGALVFTADAEIQDDDGLVTGSRRHRRAVRDYVRGKRRRHARRGQ